MNYFNFQEKTDGTLLITIPHYDPRANNKIESVFAQANGRIGIRGTQDFACNNRKPQMYHGGLFHQATAGEPDELVNLPDLTLFQISVNGQPLYLDNLAQLRRYERSFNLLTNEIVTQYDFSIFEDQLLQIEVSRFVSLSEKSLFCQRFKFRLSGESSASIVIQTGIDGQVSNEGVSHVENLQFRLLQDTMILQAKCGFQPIMVQSWLDCSDSLNSAITRKDAVLSRRRIHRILEIQASPAVEYEFSKISKICLPEQQLTTEGELQLSQEVFHKTVKAGYSNLLEKSLLKARANDLCSKIEIDGVSLEEKCLIRFAQIQLQGLIPDETDAYSIGGKGLTGEGYRGHVFWDTEIYLLPWIANFSPRSAMNLLRFRLNGLDAARKKADQFHYKGALFPWEVATDGLEKTPPFAQMNIQTGKANPVWSMLKEHHISADIAYAIEKFITATGDTSFLYQEAFPLIIETALFWCSRTTKSNTDASYHIRDVIGPDEYTEHIDDNAYTNYMAWRNVNFASELLVNLQNRPTESAQWSQTYNFTELTNQFDDFLRHIYLPQPNAENIIPQDSTFLSKPFIPNLQKYKNHPIKQAILLDYNREEVVNHQVIKQADVIMLQVLLPELFSHTVKQANLDYYEPLTLHDSSLSPCMHAIAYASIKNTSKAYNYFLHSLQLDLNDNFHDSTDGLHAASLGGVWITLVQGFAGVSFQSTGLHINPVLPSHWKSMKFKLRYMGYLLSVEITSETLAITADRQVENPDYQVHCYGEKYYLESKLTIPLMDAS